MGMKGQGVELEVNEGITEHSSRVALKGVFSNFGDVVACWVPPIDRRRVDLASVRFAAAASAEAAKQACDAGQVFLQGMQLKVQWRMGGGRRVGNSDLGVDASAEDRRGGAGEKLALEDGSGGGRRRRSRSRRRGRSRSRSRRKRSRSRKRAEAAPPALPAPVADNGLPDWLQDIAPPMGAPGAALALTGFAGMPGLPPGLALPDSAPIIPQVDPVEEAKRKEEIEKKRQERAMQAKRGPGVAALVQDALKRARAAAPTVPPKREEPPNKPPVIEEKVVEQQVVDAESEEESEETLRQRQVEEQRKAEEEARRRIEEEARMQKEREEAARRREKARREAAEAERELQAREAETRDQRIKASVEAAKKQQAERAAAKAAKDAAESLYGNMPQPDVESATQMSATMQKEAVARERLSTLSNLPPEDPTKVVFLDVDGVLRPARAGGFDTAVEGDTSTKVDTSDFFPSAMKALRHIVEKTGARIVLSSEWRRSESLKTALTDILDKNRLRPWTALTTTTEKVESGGDALRCFADRRAREISHWIQQNEKDIKGWVVLDDINIAMSDELKKTQPAKGSASIGPRLVQTWPLCGLTMGNAKTAVRILNGEMINKVVVERPVAPKAGGLHHV
eukprot:TRINITY_DN92625_c0_g1_i1.p1 TRINITY_DN92625_c0_g1~~TRINITY_DN92625_c0_g1_i1.p1  ORF type:complete len:626 (+),score=176.77 TRINITY_DN92625_c0_g1_i1:146-2023(+)